MSSKAPDTAPKRRTVDVKAHIDAGRHSDTSVSGSDTIAKAKMPTASGRIIPVLPVLIVMILLIATEKVLTKKLLGTQNPYISVVFVQFLVYLLPCAFFSAIANHRIGGGLSQYNFRLFSPKQLGFVGFSFAVLLFGNMTLKYLGYMLFGSVNSSIVIADNENMLALIAATIIVPAFTEEILFRGIVFTEYEKTGIGALGAILGSSVLFSFIHFDAENFISYVFSGIILAVAVYITKSLAASILIHLLNNGVCMFTDAFLKRVSKESISTFFVIFILLTLLLLSVFFWLECIEWICNNKADKILSKNKSTLPHPHSRLVPFKMRFTGIIKYIFLSPLFIITLVLYLIKLFIIK